MIQARSLINSKFSIKANVSLYEFPSNFTYDHIQTLTNEQRESYLVDRGSNLVVDVGLQQIIDLIIDASDTGWGYCVVGSGTNTPASGNTNMQTIIGTGIAVTNKYRSSLSAYFDTFFSTADNAGSWEETGISTTNAGTILLCRRKFGSTFTKSSSNTALVAWTITLAAVAD